MENQKKEQIINTMQKLFTDLGDVKKRGEYVISGQRYATVSKEDVADLILEAQDNIAKLLKDE